MIPPKENAEFVARMEDVLDVYQLPYDPRIPAVNMDEKPVLLHEEKRDPIPMEAGSPKRQDYEYKRNGTANIFLFTEPLSGYRYAEVTKRRTSVDWALQIKHLLEEEYPEAEHIRLVCDNLNTHKLGSLYEAFPAEEARRLAKRLEIHYTPKHGSWLNIAEVELSALSQQCLDRRIGEMGTLQREVEAWQRDRNKRQKGVNWRFTTKDARIKLKQLYPKIQE